MQVTRIPNLTNYFSNKERKQQKVILMSITSPLFISNNLLRLSFHENIPITPMKLQRLLYFIYRDYLIETDQSLFSERFEAWKYGPTLSSIYDYFHQYKSNAITHYYKPLYQVNEKTNPIFSKVLYSIWNTYKFYDGITLAKLTQKQGTAWYKAWINHKTFLEDEDIRKEKYNESLPNKTWTG